MNERGIDTVVWDADNTLWDWISMHLSGMRAMSAEISSLTGIPENEVRESMKRVYGEAGTFDYKPLVQHMDVIFKWAEGITDIRELVAKVTDLFYSTHSAYTYNRNDTFRLYDGAEDVLSTLKNSGVRNVIISDAPLSRIIRRLKHFRIEKYFSAIYGQPEPVSAQERVSGECLRHYEEIRRKSGFYDTSISGVFKLNDERKPNISFAEKFQKSEDEVADTCAVVGDNFEKDMVLAHNNNCLGVYATYGLPDETSVEGLSEYGPPTVVNRNASIVDFENLKKIQQMGEKVVAVKGCREILRHVLGEK